jgi:hypothetical protein
MSRTPYEIRLELLKLANEVLTTPIFQRRDALIQEWQASRETYANETGPRDPRPFPTLPDFPSTSEIVAKAQELNRFVSQA